MMFSKWRGPFEHVKRRRAEREIFRALTNVTFPWWNKHGIATAHTVDIIIRKDAKEHCIEGDFLKPIARILRNPKVPKP